MLARFLDAIDDLPPDAELAVAFSGGADSTALLLALHRLQQERGRPPPLALHFNHRIHRDADHWAEHCMHLCRERGVPLEIAAWERGPGERTGEASARAARYRWFGKVVAADQVLLTAHHRDDQVETVLLSLLQGRSPDRIAGMRPVRALDFGDRRRLLRPLLGQSRESLQRYLVEQGVAWLEDPANRDTNHARSWLRHEVLPSLQERWPDLEDTIAAFAESLRERLDRETQHVDTLLDSLLRPVSRRLFCLADPLSLDGLVSLSERERINVLRRWLHRAGQGSPTDGALTAFSGMMDAGRSRNLRLDGDGYTIRGYRNRLYMPGELPPAAAPLPCRGGREVLAPGLVADWPADGPPVGSWTWRWRQPGDVLRLPGRRHRTPVKKACQALGIPDWEREHLPLLVDDDGIAWMHGVGWCGGRAYRDERGATASATDVKGKDLPGPRFLFT